MNTDAGDSAARPDQVSYAPCPFRISRVLAVDEHQERRRRAKGGQYRGILQESPFKPEGAFKTRKSMNVLYFIDPHKGWLEMSRYKSFLRELAVAYTDAGYSEFWC